MPRIGNGTYVLPPENPVVTDTVITSSWANTTMPDLAAAITASLAADGQTLPTANLPMAGFHHLSVSDPTLRDQYASLGMVQDGRHTRVNIIAGPNVLAGTLVGQMSAYTPGQILSFQAQADNTGAVTLNVNGIGPVPVVNSLGADLLPGDFRAGRFYILLYNGVSFSVASGTSGGSAGVSQNKTTGQNRPSSGYVQITPFSATAVTVPGGTGVIVPPGNVGPEEALTVSWPAQNVTLVYLLSEFFTTLAVDETGAIIQYPGLLTDGVWRNSIILGTVSHVNGVILVPPTGISTRGLTYGDDGYLGKDVAILLQDVLVAGGRASASGVNPLRVNVAAGTIFRMGADLASPDSPNTVNFPAAVEIPFFPVTAINGVGASTLTAPITNYDPAGSGVITPIPGGVTTTVIHRLFFLYGSWVWSYGQVIYNDLATGLARLTVDRSQYQLPSKLSGATLVAEFVTQRNSTNLGDNVTSVIINRGGFNFQIGSVGSIGEAPADGNTYGRRNAAWSKAVAATGDTMTGDLLFRKNSPVIELSSPTNVNGYRLFSNVTDALDSGYRIDRRVGGVWIPLLTFNGALATLAASLSADGDILAAASAAQTRRIAAGAGRAGNGISSMDLISDVVYPLGSARIVRGAGANGITDYVHRGTGAWNMVAIEAARVNIGNNNITRISISEIDGRVSFPGFLDTPVVSAAAGTNRYSGYATDNLLRWTIGANATNESGANAGSDWSMIPYDDAGNPLATALVVTRATGVFDFSVPPTAPTLPTATTGDQLATLDYVIARVAGVAPGVTEAPIDGLFYARRNAGWAVAPGGGGSGTVVSFSFVDANGISGVVSNPTTNPSLTLTLGNITPSNVASVGNVSAGSGTIAGSSTAAVVAPNAAAGANGAVSLRPDGYGSAVGELLVTGTTFTWGTIAVATQPFVASAVAAKLSRDPVVQLLASASTITAAAADDAVIVTALAAAAVIANPSGAAPNERRLWYRIKDNGTARGLSWGSEFRAAGKSLPTTTVAGKTLRVGFLRNATDIRWDCVAVAQEA